MKIVFRGVNPIIISVLLLFPLSICAQGPVIVNPIAPHGHDPWVIKHKNVYYYCYSSEGGIWVNKGVTIRDACQFTGKEIWVPEAGKAYSQEIWAPELHYIKKKWYIYFAADNGKNENHRMYALESCTGDPLGVYILKGKIFDSTDRWAIDGTILNYRRNLYFIWSGWEGDVNVSQNLYIAKMANPTTIISKRVEVSHPDYDWEKIGNPLVNEGPEILHHGKDIFIIYSASGSWTDNYCLGQLKLAGKNPLDRKSWIKKQTPVFGSTGTVFSPGHASFTKSPDGKEDWIIYHTARKKGAGWDRDVNMKEFFWTKGGNPDFGYPESKGVQILAPSKR